MKIFRRLHLSSIFTIFLLLIISVQNVTATDPIVLTDTGPKDISTTLTISGDKILDLKAECYLPEHGICAVWYSESTYDKWRGLCSASIPWPGNADCDGEIELSTMPQGELKIRGVARHYYDYRVTYDAATEDYIVDVDNTPELTAEEVTETDGIIDISGTLKANPVVTHKYSRPESYLYITWTDPDGEILYNYRTYKLYTDSYDPVPWSWEEMFYDTIYAGELKQGTHTFNIQARAYNFAMSEPIERTINIDNTPVLTAMLSDSNGVFGSSITAEGEVDIKGSVQLKPVYYYAAGELYFTWIEPDGTTLYNKTKVKDFYTDSFEPVFWSWEDLSSAPLQDSEMKEGTHTFIFQARSYNNTWSEPVELALTVSSTPDLTVNVNHKSDGEIDISGTVEFKPCSSRPGGELSVTWKTPSGNITTLPSFGPLSFTGSSTNSWTWEDLGGGIIDAGQLAEGTHTLTFTAKAYSGAKREFSFPLEIENKPLVKAYIEGTEGEIKMYGSVEFKPVLDPSVPEGIFFLDVTSPSGEDYATYRDCPDTMCYWDWESLNKGKVIDAGILEQGAYNCTFRARAHNGTWSDTVERTLNVDNTPEVTIDKMTLYQNGNSYKSAEFDIEGTIRFKEVVSSYDGTLQLYVGTGLFDKQYLGEIKYDDQHNVGTWHLTDFTNGSRPKLADYPEEIFVSVLATAYNKQGLAAMRTFYSDCFAADSTMNCDDDIETVSNTDPNKKLDELEDSLPDPAVEHGKPFGNEDSLPDPAVEHGKPFGESTD